MELSPGQWERVKELYENALERDRSRRDTFLQESEKDEAVRKEVSRLLAEHDHLGSFFSNSPLVDPSLDRPRTSARLSAGEFLAGRFRIVDFIAAGGMGEVYKAEDTRLDRTVALKFLPHELSENRQSLDRLRGEAKAASALNHPNICTVYDLDEDAGRAFIAMEFLEGETLSARLKAGPLPVEGVFHVAIQIASALGAAHRKGIIHRDLKPGNIMLTETGVKLLDFGLAKQERPTTPDAETASVVTGPVRIVGTLPYMSPEQLKCGNVDASGDVFAFGAVLYEMLTGVRAFERRSSSDTIAALIHEDPRPLKELAKDIPVGLERIVARCLQKQSQERYASMQPVQQELEECRARTTAASGINLRLLWAQRKKPAIAIPVLLGLLMLVGFVGWWIHREGQIRWARNEALPQIARLIEAEKSGDAYALAVQAERYIPRDPTLAKYWDSMSYSIPIRTIPPGASVYRKNYRAGDGEWEFVGVSPIEKGRFALVDSRWKFELKGYAPVELATFADYTPDFVRAVMTKEAETPSGMVHATIQEPGSTEARRVGLYYMPGFTHLPPVPLQDFWIDKFEVTNRQFKAFLDAGGYQNPTYWDQEFRNGSRVLTWKEAMGLFQDSTGRAGPAKWVQGEYPKGQDDFPVSGVSWFEAAAYAKFVGKSLPTIFHWKVAVSREASESIVPVSNFSTRGPSQVGVYQGVSRFGTYDMAGNVKEWVWNRERSGKHFILGGAWDEPEFDFLNADARSPFDRRANFGFRCAKYSPNGDSEKAAGVIDREVRNYAKEKPVSDEVFRAFKNLYAYDKTPLNARVESVKHEEDWDLQKITYDAAYGKERIIAYLYVPRKASPPYQVVMYFPGGDALFESSSENHPQLGAFDFVVKSGRAVLFPVYKGTYERLDGYEVGPKNTSKYRDHVIAWGKDFRRSIDYLETRQDIDTNRIGYLGVSLGGTMAAIMPALDPRLKALVLNGPGFYMQKMFPEADAFNFAPHVKTPTLMMNGRYDFIYPPDSSQEPFARLLGTPKADKRRVVFDCSHEIPRVDMIKESLTWLDRYLGPVR
jgi:cephalosporin-C deacetylase-like acetyl esterase